MQQYLDMLLIYTIGPLVVHNYCIFYLMLIFRCFFDVLGADNQVRLMWRWLYPAHYLPSTPTMSSGVPVTHAPWACRGWGNRTVSWSRRLHIWPRRSTPWHWPAQGAGPCLWMTFHRMLRRWRSCFTNFLIFLLLKKKTAYSYKTQTALQGFFVENNSIINCSIWLLTSQKKHSLNSIL